MADYGTVGRELSLSGQVIKKDEIASLLEYDSMNELGISGQIYLLDNPEVQISGIEEFPLSGKIISAPPWSGMGTVPEYIYVGGGISIY
jgi:hypothetical protein